MTSTEKPTQAKQQAALIDIIRLARLGHPMAKGALEVLLGQRRDTVQSMPQEPQESQQTPPSAQES